MQGKRQWHSIQKLLGSVPSTSSVNSVTKNLSQSPSRATHNTDLCMLTPDLPHAGKLTAHGSSIGTMTRYACFWQGPWIVVGPLQRTRQKDASQFATLPFTDPKGKPAGGSYKLPLSIYHSSSCFCFDTGSYHGSAMALVTVKTGQPQWELFFGKNLIGWLSCCMVTFRYSKYVKPREFLSHQKSPSKWSLLLSLNSKSGQYFVPTSTCEELVTFLPDSTAGSRRWVFNI